MAEEVTPSFATRKASNPFHGTVESILSQQAVSVEVNSVSLNHYSMHDFTYAISKHIVSRENFV